MNTVPKVGTWLFNKKSKHLAKVLRTSQSKHNPTHKDVFGYVNRQMFVEYAYLADYEPVEIDEKSPRLTKVAKEVLTINNAYQMVRRNHSLNIK